LSDFAERSEQVQTQQAIHTVNAFVIPAIALPPQRFERIPKVVARWIPSTAWITEYNEERPHDSLKREPWDRWQKFDPALSEQGQKDAVGPGDLAVENNQNEYGHIGNPGAALLRSRRRLPRHT
jgi:hypothetical protein